MRATLLITVLMPIAAQASFQMAVIAYGDCGDDVAGRHARDLRGVLASRLKTALLSEEQTTTALGGAARGSLADAERALAAARTDFFQDASERAAGGLKAAAEALLLLPASEARARNFREATLLLAWLQLKAGQKANAETQVRRVLAVDPGHVPDPNTFPPSFRTFADGIRQRMRKEERATLTVSTHPVGKPVFVDGSPIGSSPARVQLPKGEHLVEVDFGYGQRGLSKHVDLRANEEISLAEAFEGSVFVDRGPCLKTTEGREGGLIAVVRLASLLQVPSIAAVKHQVLGSGEQYIIATLVDAQSGQELREAKVRVYAAGTPPGALDRLADFITTGAVSPPLETDAPRATRLTPSIEAGSRGAPALTPERPARGVGPGTLATGGVAVAAAVVASIFFVNANSAQAQLNQTKSNRGTFGAGSEDAYAAQAGGISTNRTIALSGAIIAVASAATSLILALRPDEAAAETTKDLGAK